MTANIPDVSMFLRSLPAAPVTLASGLRVRTYGAGDERTWLRIHRDVESYGPIPAALFGREFGDHPAALPKRQFFVVTEAGYAVATATAWFPQPNRSPLLGRLHWVAVIPAFQRQGIASALVRYTCASMADLGYEAAYLTTGGDNYPAVALYLSLGFEPEINDAADERDWDRILTEVDSFS